MIVDLIDAADLPGVGTKARILGQLKAHGFGVPDAFVVTGGVLDRALRGCHRDRTLARSLGDLTTHSVERVSRELDAALAGLRLPDDVHQDIQDRVKPDHRYAVRSSGTREDLADLSFAGQYRSFLDVECSALPAALLGCYRSLFSEPVLHYMLDNGIEPDTTGMSVIVQEMVDADVSGVAFTVNPVTGADTEIVIEVAPGLGDQVVAGHVTPERYCYDWYRERDVTLARGSLLTSDEQAAVSAAALRIQRLYGYPCDVEFAMAGGELFILQARPITRIGYAGIADQWTTANFKDGGVSATVCTPFMWSLYEYIWERELRRFLLRSRLLGEADLRKLGRMSYGRPYWNLSVAKTAMARVPGYRERQFDSELGVRITYPGDGQVTRITPRSLWRAARIALAMRGIVAERRGTAQPLKDELLATYRDREARLDAPFEPAELQSAWYRLVTADYLRSEGTYFWQVFINTVQQALSKERITRLAGDEAYFALIGGLEDLSHLLPGYEMWDISRRIRSDPASLRFWTETDAPGIAGALESGNDEHHLGEIRALRRRFGYHSARELDLTYPDYAEDPVTVVALVQDTVRLEERYSPRAGRAKLAAAYQAELERVRAAVPARRFRAFAARIEATRRLLWWREEFRDVSTHFYHLIRMYTLRLAHLYRESGVLADESDIWFARMDDLCDYIDGRSDREELRRTIQRNRAYHESFRNYQNEHEIGAGYDGSAPKRVRAGNTSSGIGGALAGIGGNPGVVTGPARVIAGIDEIDRLRPGDILVTRFTDTGWTSRFAMLRGIVTEYGGVLCHAAIVSREYAIPCVVCAENATSRIADGDTIRVDGGSGEIAILAGAQR